jgi:hypothetical protein
MTRVLWVFFFIVCQGCTLGIRGTYVLNIPGTKDTLFVRSNYTFRQHAVLNARHYYNEGIWNYDHDGFIGFDGFIWYAYGYGPEDLRKSYWLATQSSSIFHRPALIVNEDLEYMYVRISSD